MAARTLKDLLRYLKSPTSGRASTGLRNLAGNSVGAGESRRPLAVFAQASVRIFLCQDGQGGRGKGSNTKTFGGSESDGKGVWMSIWVEDVDEVYRRCLDEDLDVTFPRPIWNGTSAKFTFATPTATSFASAAGSARSNFWSLREPCLHRGQRRQGDLSGAVHVSESFFSTSERPRRTM
jgi:hypothetical protein